MKRTVNLARFILALALMPFVQAECLEPFCAEDVSVSTTESSSITIGDDETLLVNFSDFADFTYTVNVGPTKGALTNNNDGTFTFEPNSEFDELGSGESEQVTFTYYIAAMNTPNSNTATITINVNGEGSVANIRIESDTILYDQVIEDGLLSPGELVHVGFVFHANADRSPAYDYLIEGWSSYLDVVSYDVEIMTDDLSVFEYEPELSTDAGSPSVAFPVVDGDEIMKVDVRFSNPISMKKLVIHVLFRVKDNVALIGVPDIIASEVRVSPAEVLFSEAVSLTMSENTQPFVKVFKQTQPSYSDDLVKLHLMVVNPLGSTLGDINAQTTVTVTQQASDSTFSCDGVTLDTNALNADILSGSIGVNCTNSGQTIELTLFSLLLAEDDFLVVPVSIPYTENPFTGNEWTFEGSVTLSNNEQPAAANLPSRAHTRSASPFATTFDESYIQVSVRPPSEGTDAYVGSSFYANVLNEPYDVNWQGSVNLLLIMDSDFNCSQTLYGATASDLVEIICENNHLGVAYAKVSSDSSPARLNIALQHGVEEAEEDVYAFNGFAYLSLHDQMIGTVTQFRLRSVYDHITEEEDKKKDSLSAFSALMAVFFSFWVWRRRSSK